MVCLLYSRSEILKFRDTGGREGLRLNVALRLIEMEKGLGCTHSSNDLVGCEKSALGIAPMICDLLGSARAHRYVNA
jgi:hypothetical protein